MFLSVNLAQQDLGLTVVQMSELKANVDLIIHNAWKVDFNALLDHFEDIHIRGTRNLIDWSISSQRQPRVVFISSVSSTSNWAEVYGDATPVPEDLLYNYEIASNIGYGQSKNVAESILGISSQRSCVPVSIFCLGQVAGSTLPEDFPWPEQEWVPSLLKTSKSLGLLPRDLPLVDWISINHLAETILVIACSDYKLEQDDSAYNLVNPRSTSWESLLDTIQGQLGSDIKVVPFKTWLTSLEEKQDLQNIELMSALKLLGFFQELKIDRSVNRYEMKRVLETSLWFNWSQ
ncbi:hypothetical protein BDR22DRAFT_850107 [Usnea florida]